MSASDLRDRLFVSAAALGWDARHEPEFTRARFRGRDDETSAPLPPEVYGLRLGHFPTLVAPVRLGNVDELKATLRMLYTQMVIARSYMRPDEVINAHIMLCAVGHSTPDDWRTVIDVAERDETVCRKIVWIPDVTAMDASYREFVARTFLAMPWREADERLDAPLDSNQGLVERVLARHGLTTEVAHRWVELAKDLRHDPDALVSALVSAAEDVR